MDDKLISINKVKEDKKEKDVNDILNIVKEYNSELYDTLKEKINPDFGEIEVESDTKLKYISFDNSFRIVVKVSDEFVYDIESRSLINFINIIEKHRCIKINNKNYIKRTWKETFNGTSFERKTEATNLYIKDGIIEADLAAVYDKKKVQMMEKSGNKINLFEFNEDCICTTYLKGEIEDENFIFYEGYIDDIILNDDDVIIMYKTSDMDEAFLNLNFQPREDYSKKIYEKTMGSDVAYEFIKAMINKNIDEIFVNAISKNIELEKDYDLIYKITKPSPEKCRVEMLNGKIYEYSKDDMTLIELQKDNYAKYETSDKLVDIVYSMQYSRIGILVTKTVTDFKTHKAITYDKVPLSEDYDIIDKTVYDFNDKKITFFEHEYYVDGTNHKEKGNFTIRDKVINITYKEHQMQRGAILNFASRMSDKEKGMILLKKDIIKPEFADGSIIKYKSLETNDRFELISDLKQQELTSVKYALDRYINSENIDYTRENKKIEYTLDLTNTKEVLDMLSSLKDKIYLELVKENKEK